MTGYDVDDIAFLTGENRSPVNKRALYEPSGMTDRMRQIILSPRKVCIFSLSAGVFILTIALIVAFARPFTCKPNLVISSNVPNIIDVTTTPAPTPPTATNGELFPWEEIRLPPFILPIYYDIFVHPNLTTFTFDGLVNITFTVDQPEHFIVLHSRQLNLSEAKLLNNDHEIKRILEYEKHEQIFIEFSKPLYINKNYTLSIQFHGNLTKQLQGFYLSSYRTKAGQERYLATTQFEPTYARMAFPCFDEPAMKAVFRLSVVREMNHIALFNMPKDNSLNYPGGLALDIFHESVKMSTYLVAFIVCDFKSVSSVTKHGTKVSVYASEDKTNQIQFALELATGALDYFETFFELPYPLPKQDLVAIPDFSAGAMENWGLITYRETSILVNINETSSNIMQGVALTVTHELAHQWFGNLVTMQWWNDLWLNEGFASFMEYICTDNLKPTWRMMDQFVTSVVQNALFLDAFASSHPISVSLKDPNTIESMFDTISYSKGSSIIYMLQSFLKPETLRRGLQSYLKKFQYKNANTEDLWNALSQESSLDSKAINVKEVMDTWTQQMGFPIINISRTGNRITASQQRFLVSAQEDDVKPEYISKYNYKWYVPLTCITDQSNQPELRWMNMTDVEFELQQDIKWIKCNVNQSGFYRVTYDTAMWMTLIDVLNKNHEALTSGDRANLIDDAFTLSRYNMLDPLISIQILSYLKFEKSLAPWDTAIAQLNSLFMLFHERPAFIYLKEYIRNLIIPVTDHLKFDDTGEQLERLLRVSILNINVYVQNNTVTQILRSRFEDWKNNRIRIPQDLRGLVYSTGIQFGTYEDWKYCWEKFNTSVVASEKQLLLVALGASRDPWILSQYLDFTLQPDKIRLQDVPSVIRIVASNPVGQPLAWRFVRNNWNILYQKLGRTSSIISIIKGVTAKFTTKFDLQEAQSFFGNLTEIGTGKRAVQNSLEKICSNIAWLENNEFVVTEWLKRKYSVRRKNVLYF